MSHVTPPPGSADRIVGAGASETYNEPGHNVPIVRHSDVLVCGGGPAGVTAAISAARSGAKTSLVDVNGCLGGVWTAGLLSWVIDSMDKPGIMREIIEELDRRGARRAKNKGFVYDPEEMKLLLDEMCATAGVEVLLHTRVVAAACDESNGLTLALTESKSGRQAWASKIFIDASGDGDLAAFAGCGFDTGHPRSGVAQPMSLVMLVTGIRYEEVKRFVGGGERLPKELLAEEIERAGVAPSYSRPVLLWIRDDLFALIANHEYATSATDAAQITHATVRARREVHQIVNSLRQSGGCWANLRLVATGSQIGVREGRRIYGRYTVTEEDMRNGVRHEDGICRVAFGIDVHSLNPKQSRAGSEVNRTKVKPYDIPLRALIARDVDRLMLAGRCISGDFLAHSSYRVTGNAVAMGQAAGAVAARAALTDRLPQEVSLSELTGATEVVGASQ